MYAEQIRKTRDTYNQELQNYDFLIRQKEILIDDYNKYIEKANKKQVEAEQTLRDTLLKINQTWDENMRRLLWNEVKDFVAAEQLKVTAAEISSEKIWEARRKALAGEKPVVHTGIMGMLFSTINPAVLGLRINRMLQTFFSGLHLPSLQGGGYVRETGLAVVHRGETVVPNNKGLRVHVEPITINVNITDNADVEHLVQKIELAVQSGLISGVQTSYS